MRFLSRRFAIVPARGGSKRIPRKNIRPFLGVPIMVRTLRTLESIGMFERIIVSTEDSEIAALALAYGFEVPFIRPANLSTDSAPTHVVATHAIEWLLENGASRKDNFLLAYPTSVMVTPEQITDAENLLAQPDCDFVFAAAKFPSNIERAWRARASSFAEPVCSGAQQMRSQDLEPTYFDAGQFYWSTAEGWDKVGQGRENRMIYEIPLEDAIDINELSDWIRAERAFKGRSYL